MFLGIRWLFYTKWMNKTLKVILWWLFLSTKDELVFWRDFPWTQDNILKSFLYNEMTTYSNDFFILCICIPKNNTKTTTSYEQVSLYV